MRQASSRRPNAAVLPFEVLQLEAPDASPSRKRPEHAERALPLYVAPLPEESLFSWLLRLAARLEVSFHTLARQTFGIDDRSGKTRWWHRPHPWTLARIAQRTGVKSARLREMTFEDLQPPYREDEDPVRFGGRRYDSWGPNNRAYRFTICGPCCEADATPYVRSIWQLGWLAVCPIHNTILISRCSYCRSGVRTQSLANGAAFSPTECARCGESLLIGCYPFAHPAVARVQTALLNGKRHGSAELDGLGSFSWHELVALIDVVVGAFWLDTTLEERTAVLRRYTYPTADDPTREVEIYNSRHDSLRFFAWLIEDWPKGEGSKIGYTLLCRGLQRKRNRLCHHVLPSWKGHPWSPSPHDFTLEIRARLRALIEEYD